MAFSLCARKHLQQKPVRNSFSPAFRMQKGGFKIIFVVVSLVMIMTIITLLDRPPAAASHMGPPKKIRALSGSPYHKDYHTLGSITGFPFFGKYHM